MKRFLGEVEMFDLDQPYRHFDRRKEYHEIEATEEAEAKDKLSWAFLREGKVTRVWEQ